MGIIGKIAKFALGESKTMAKDILKVMRLPVDVGKGYKQGARLSRIQNKNSIFTGLKNRSVGVLRKGIAPHMGGIFGIVSYPIPVPLVSTAFYYIGKKTGKGMSKILR